MTSTAATLAPARRNGDDEPRWIKTIKTVWPIFVAVIVVIGNSFVMGYRVDQLERRLADSPTRIEIQNMNESLKEIRDSVKRVEDRQYQQVQQAHQQVSVKGSNGGSR